ncbi:MAG: VCBS repeat-containing protein, partial [Planctomycetes bacterium]|nr:VCBS repeat-containing protein [Planctomycetota bacterium]
MAATIAVPAIAFALVAVWPLVTSPSDGKTRAKVEAAGRDRVRFDLNLPAQEAARLLPPPDESRQGPTPRLLDVASAAGIQFTYYPDAVPGRFFLPEDLGGGAGWLDFDGDGRLDLFLTNGCRLPCTPSDRTHVQKLFRQVATGQFVEVGELAGVALVLYGQGCTVGDIDNDGFPDIVVTAYGNVTLLVNNGDGTFAADVQHARLDDPGWSTSAALGDVNRDGSLDLYVAHYAVVSLEDIPVCTYESEHGKTRGYCGPASYVAEPHALLLNNESGSFGKFELTAGAAPKQPGKGLGLVIADLDGDGWPEVYVANDMDPNYLFHNMGNDPEAPPRFEEVAMRAGAALSGEGKPEAGMGLACADFDGDGDLDLFITHYYLEKNTYYENAGHLSFLDRSSYTGLAAPSLPFLGFGTVPIDYDLDGWQDLFVANGHVLGKQIKPYAMRPQLFRNTGKARFVELTSRAGPYFFDERVGRGAAMADYDNDGDEDVLVVHIDDRPVSLLRNDTQRLGRPLGLELVGTSSPRSAIGAQVFVRAGDQTWMR